MHPACRLGLKRCPKCSIQPTRGRLDKHHTFTASCDNGGRLHSVIPEWCLMPAATWSLIYFMIATPTLISHTLQTNYLYWTTCFKSQPHHGKYWSSEARARHCAMVAGSGAWQQNKGLSCTTIKKQSEWLMTAGILLWDSIKIYKDCCNLIR